MGFPADISRFDPIELFIGHTQFNFVYYFVDAHSIE